MVLFQRPEPTVRHTLACEHNEILVRFGVGVHDRASCTVNCWDFLFAFSLELVCGDSSHCDKKSIHIDTLCISGAQLGAIVVISRRDRICGGTQEKTSNNTPETQRWTPLQSNLAPCMLRFISGKKHWPNGVYAASIIWRKLYQVHLLVVNDRFSKFTQHYYNSQSAHGGRMRHWKGRFTLMGCFCASTFVITLSPCVTMVIAYWSCSFVGLLGQRSRHGLHTMRTHILLFGMYKGSEDVSDLQKEDRKSCADLHFMKRMVSRGSVSSGFKHW